MNAFTINYSITRQVLIRLCGQPCRRIKTCGLLGLFTCMTYFWSLSKQAYIRTCMTKVDQFGTKGLTFKSCLWIVFCIQRDEMGSSCFCADQRWIINTLRLAINTRKKPQALIVLQAGGRQTLTSWHRFVYWFRKCLDIQPGFRAAWRTY